MKAAVMVYTASDPPRLVPVDPSYFGLVDYFALYPVSVLVHTATAAGPLADYFGGNWTIACGGAGLQQTIEPEAVTSAGKAMLVLTQLAEEIPLATAATMRLYIEDLYNTPPGGSDARS
jgi:hypothetical protein